MVKSKKNGKLFWRNILTFFVAKKKKNGKQFIVVNYYVDWGNFIFSIYLYTKDTLLKKVTPRDHYTIRGNQSECPPFFFFGKRKMFWEIFSVQTSFYSIGELLSITYFLNFCGKFWNGGDWGWLPVIYCWGDLYLVEEKKSLKHVLFSISQE